MQIRGVHNKKVGYSGDELLKLHDLIFNSWLPNCQYIQTDNLEIKGYHLQTDKMVRKNDIMKYGFQ